MFDERGDERGPRPPEVLGLEDRRRMTDINHLLAARQPDGSYDQNVVADVYANKVTQVAEDGVRRLVTKIYQPSAEVVDEAGRLKRTFMWMGRTAMQVATSGYDFHFSEQGFACVGVEENEAGHGEEELTPGISQSFLSLKFTAKDAPKHIAEAEHRAHEDAVRTSRAVLDKDGEVMGREMSSLLVTDVPHAAWVAMLKDPKNPFGKAFEISDEDSAFPIMELHDQMDTPDEMLPEGPITIVAEVVNYITDLEARAKVEKQIVGWREEQAYLRTVTEETATKWVKFDTQLAESLHKKQMQPEVRLFVLQQQDLWPDDVLQLLKMHEKGGDYTMSQALSAKIEQGWHKIHIGEAAVLVGDERSLKNMTKNDVKRLQDNIQFISMMKASGLPPEEIAHLETQHYREIARSRVKPGGGCSDRNNMKFKDGDPDGFDGIPREATTDTTENSTDKIGKKKKGVCRIENCPSRPGQTMVGGCDVCLDYCQKLFDQNLDPEDVYSRSDTPTEQESDEIWALFDIFEKKIEDDEAEVSPKQSAEEKQLADEAEEFLVKMSGQVALAGVN